MPYHQNSKISSVIALASQELVSSFHTACSAPVVDSIVPKDTGMITQLKFGCVVLWNGVTRRKNGQRNTNRYAPVYRQSFEKRADSTKRFPGFPARIIKDISNSWLFEL